MEDRVRPRFPDGPRDVRRVAHVSGNPAYRAPLRRAENGTLRRHTEAGADDVPPFVEELPLEPLRRESGGARDQRASRHRPGVYRSRSASTIIATSSENVTFGRQPSFSRALEG